MVDLSFREEIARRIKEARLEAGMTQLQLAQKSGTTNSMISFYESAKRTPGLKNMAMMCKALGKSLDEFVPDVELCTHYELPGQTRINL